MRPALVLMSAGLLAWPAAASAQTPFQPRFEVGGQGGAFVLAGADDGGLALAIGPRVSMRVGPRSNVELVTEVVAPTDSLGLHGFYNIVITNVLRDGGPGRTTLLFTAGASGMFEYHRPREYRDERPDGSVVVYPAQTRASIRGPVAAVAGIGFHRPVSGRAAFRSDVQALFGRFGGVIVRATVGFSVPIGGRYVPPR